MSVCCFKKNSSQCIGKDKKNHIWGNIQSLWQDVKYYFIFLISFLDVNIVVNTNLYLNITVCLLPFFPPPFQPSAASCSGRLNATTRKYCCLAVTLVQLKVSVSPNKTSRLSRASVISERKLENHLFLMSRGLFAGKLEMFGLHNTAAEGLVWVNHKNEPYWQ